MGEAIASSLGHAIQIFLSIYFCITNMTCRSFSGGYLSAENYAECVTWQQYQKEKSPHPISKWKSVMRDLCTQIGFVLQEGIAARSPGYAGAYRSSCSAWETAPL